MLIIHRISTLNWSFRRDSTTLWRLFASSFDNDLDVFECVGWLDRLLPRLALTYPWTDSLCDSIDLLGYSSGA